MPGLPAASFFVGGKSVSPAWKPAGLLTGRRRILDSAGEDLVGRIRKSIGRGFARRNAHGLKHLKQSPPLAFVSLGGRYSLAFEIHVVHERVGAERFAGHEIEIFPDAFAIGRRGSCENFRECLFQAKGGEAGLQGDGFDEERPQFFHAGAVEVGKKRRAVRPWAVGLEAGGHLDSLALQVADEVGKAFVEGAASALGIPDKVPDAEGGKFFAFIPAGESFVSARTLVFPEPIADFAGGSIGDFQGFGCAGQDWDKQTHTGENWPHAKIFSSTFPFRKFFSTASKSTRLIRS